MPETPPQSQPAIDAGAAAELLAADQPEPEPEPTPPARGELHTYDEPTGAEAREYEDAAAGLVRQVDRIAAKASRGRIPREDPQDMADTLAAVRPLARHAGGRLGPRFWFWSGVLTVALFILGKLLAMVAADAERARGAQLTGPTATPSPLPAGDGTAMEASNVS